MLRAYNRQRHWVMLMRSMRSGEADTIPLVEARRDKF